MEFKETSSSVMKRLPTYLNYLKNIKNTEKLNISSSAIASALGLTEIVVRKDIATVTKGGKPKVGYLVKELINDLELFLGYKNVDNAVVVGAGNLGLALKNYSGFKNYGLHILAAFDIDENVINSKNRIFHIDKLQEFCVRLNIHIGIITVPEQNAQAICDLLISCGIKAIWNFAPIHLNAPKEILIQNEDMGTSLATLSKHLEKQLMEE